MEATNLIYRYQVIFDKTSIVKFTSYARAERHLIQAGYSEVERLRWIKIDEFGRERHAFLTVFYPNGK